MIRSNARVAAALEAVPEGQSPVEALLGEGVISERVYYASLAAHLGSPFDCGERPMAAGLDAVRAAASGVAPLAWRADEPRALFAPRGPWIARLIEAVESGRLAARNFALTTPSALVARLRALNGAEILNAALRRLPDAATARRGASAVQFAAVVASLVAFAAVGMWSLRAFDVLTTIAFGVVFLAVVILRLLAGIASGETHRQRPVSDADLPIYTIIAPLYRELEVLEQLVGALRRLRYPLAKLDIKLVAEADDKPLLAALGRMDLPFAFDLVVAPAGEPRTKPRALNVALQFARGEFVVVYDAEDLPAPNQLRLAAAKFRADASLDCLQARLTIRNAADSWLSRHFAVEYAVLFDLVNPGLCALEMPIALGGTSNHFRTASLVAAGAWDPWNVAEDADLGIRLARKGLRVGALESDTSEEAPNAFGNWFHQRVRWQKGWIQTCIVHSRRPRRFVADLGGRRALAAASLVLGAVLSGLFGPLFAAETVWRALAAASSTPSLLKEATDVVTYGLAIAGVAAVLLPAIVAADRRGLALPFGLIVTLPLYYGLISFATWVALIDLARRPHHWAKTFHGMENERRSAHAKAVA